VPTHCDRVCVCVLITVYEFSWEHVCNGITMTGITQCLITFIAQLQYKQWQIQVWNHWSYLAFI